MGVLLALCIASRDSSRKEWKAEGKKEHQMMELGIFSVKRNTVSDFSPKDAAKLVMNPTHL